VLKGARPLNENRIFTDGLNGRADRCAKLPDMPRPPQDCARRPGIAAVAGGRWPALALVLLCGCAGAQSSAGAEFWRDALPDPVVELEPAVDLPDAGSTTVRDVDAEVIGQVRARSAAGQYTLQLRASGQAMALHYNNVGFARKLPLQVGETVHLTLWQRLEPNATVVERGLVITGRRPGPAGNVQQVLAVVNMNGVVPYERLPPTLTVVTPVDVLAYQAAEREGGECYLAVAHNRFSIGAEPGSGQRAARPLVAPGSRVKLWDGTSTYEVAMHDNRATLNATCLPRPQDMWSYAAIWLPEKAPPSPQPQAVDLEKLPPLPASPASPASPAAKTSR